MESECIIFIVIYNILSLPEAAEGFARLEAQLKDRVWPKLWPD